MNILPERGNFETMSTIERIRNKLFPQEEEVSEFELVQNGKTVTWNAKGDEKRDIELSDVQNGFLIGLLEGVSSKSELDYDQYLILKEFKADKEK